MREIIVVQTDQREALYDVTPQVRAVVQLLAVMKIRRKLAADA